MIKGMDVKLANHAGFCFGVERAIEVAKRAADEYSNVSTFGPIIHNPQVVAMLEADGISVINELSEVRSDSVVVVRSHGIEKELMAKLNEKAFKVIDATCPFVLKAQASASELSKRCETVVLLGEHDHPEVKGIVSYAETECIVISGVEEALGLSYKKSFGFLAQTTQNLEIFLKISDILAGKCEELEVIKTICNATTSRQKASIELASVVDVMIVIGGKNSANTTRLYHQCIGICPKTYHIETSDELDLSQFKGVSIVGITAGASTPRQFIHEVREYILRLRNDERT